MVPYFSQVTYCNVWGGVGKLEIERHEEIWIYMFTEKNHVVEREGIYWLNMQQFYNILQVDYGETYLYITEANITVIRTGKSPSLHHCRTEKIQNSELSFETIPKLYLLHALM